MAKFSFNITGGSERPAGSGALRRWLSNAKSQIAGNIQRWIDRITNPSSEPPAAGDFGRPPPKPPSSSWPWGGEEDEDPAGGDADEEEAKAFREWHVLSSSNVGETRYLAEEKILEIRFLSNYYYQYFEVPAEIFRDFIVASSPGRFVWNVIRANGYDYDRIGAGVIPSYKQPSGWKPWRKGTHGRTQKDRVARIPLPEEVEGHGKVLDPSSGMMIPVAQSIFSGESVKVPHVKLKLKRWANDWQMPPRDNH